MRQSGPPCDDRLGSVQFFPPAHRADRPAVHHRPALVEPSPSAQLGEEGLKQATPDATRSHSTKRRQHVLPEPHPFHAVTSATATRRAAARKVEEARLAAPRLRWRVHWPPQEFP